MIYAYIRISTDLQHQENQKFEIENFAKNNSINIDKWITETVSSKKPLEERKLGKNVYTSSLYECWLSNMDNKRQL